MVPVVTNRGGAGEFIQDGINGFLRDPEDVEGMAAAGVQVLGDPALRPQWPRRPGGTPPANSAPPAS